MIFFFTELLLLLVIFIEIILKKYDSPVLIFSLIWFFIIGLYTINLIGMYQIKNSTELVLSVGIISFILGYFVSKSIKRTVRVVYSNKQIKYGLWNVIAILCFVFSIGFYSMNLSLLVLGYSSDQIKMMLVTGELGWGGPIMQFFVRPFEYSIIPISCYCLLFNRKQFFLVISGIFFTVGEFIGMGSKTALVYFSICFLLTSYYTKTKKNFSFRQIVLIVIAVISVLSYLFLRMGWKSFYAYLCGCVPMLDKIINESFYMYNGHSFGFLSFNSIIRFFIHAVSFLGIRIDSNLYALANSYYSRFEHTTEIGPGMRYNAFHTFVGDFYVDFGLIGVIILSFLFGFFCFSVYFRFKKENGFHFLITYCITMYYLFFSMVRFQLSNTFIGLALLYSIVFNRFLTNEKALFYHKGETYKLIMGKRP